MWNELLFVWFFWRYRVAAILMTFLEAVFAINMCVLVCVGWANVSHFWITYVSFMTAKDVLQSF